jgi:prephenate dehydrogenase
VYLQNFVIIGSNGGFGMLLSNLLSEAGYNVGGIDLQATPAAAGLFSDYVSSNILEMSEAATALIREAECVILSLPEEVALACFPNVVETVTPGSLILDVLSVKSAIVSLMEEVEKTVELLSLHPMFAPEVGFREQNVVVIEVRPGPLSVEILAFIENCGSNVTLMTAEQHDASTAAIQVATHAALISFGLALNKMGYGIEETLRMSTPLHRIMLALLARVLAGDPEIYWRIQLKHPLSSRARHLLMQSLEGLDAAVQAHDFAEFESLIQAARTPIASEMERLTDYCGEIFRTRM